MVNIGTIGTGIIQLVVAIILAVIALYIGFWVFGKITKLDEQKELANGNVAVGILIASIFVAIGIVVGSGVSGLSKGLSGDLIALAAGIIQLILGIIFAIVAIYIALKVIDKMTPRIPLFEELKKGNVAAALAMSGVTVTTAIIIQSGVAGITAALV